MLPNPTRRFGRDQSGNIGTGFALALIPAVAVASLAIDFGRALKSRADLQAMTDIAAISGARISNGSDSTRKAAAEASFASNQSGPDTLTPVVSAANGVVTVTAETTVDTTFARLLGFSSFEIKAESKATAASGKQLELSMMVDLTGSMGEYRSGTTKIAGLKSAADDLLGILFPNGATTSSNVRVAIAPFSDYVNAGGYAADVTGLPATGGTYDNRTNLASTRQGTFIGTYSGATGNTTPAGMTSPSGILTASGTTVPTSNNAAGQPFTNGHCAVPTNTSTAGVQQVSGRKGGVRVPRLCSNNWCSLGSYYAGTPNAGMLASSDSDVLSDVNRFTDPSGNPALDWYFHSGGNLYYAQARDNAHYVPLLTSTTGLTVQTRTANGSTGEIGVPVYNEASYANINIKRNNAGFWRAKEINVDGSINYEWVAAVSQVNSWNSWYVPIYENLTTTTTVAGCELIPQVTSQLISCVTERTGTERYTDAGPSGNPVGRYNAGRNQVYNYSSNGKCFVAGREMPSIIPLTNDKATLTSFFNNATVGGATPGHIGTAWAWYMLSPNWSSVFSGPALPTAYNTPNVMKVAVLMTDGEYNIHYATPSAREQALELCANMKAAGVTVYTVGFGFSSTSVANANGNAEERAKDLLTKCASGTNKYFFPYDGAQLRQDFQTIGQALMGEMTTTTAKLTD